jgi:hypothetical protein
VRERSPASSRSPRLHSVASKSACDAQRAWSLPHHFFWLYPELPKAHKGAQAERSVGKFRLQATLHTVAQQKVQGTDVASNDPNTPNCGHLRFRSIALGTSVMGPLSLQKCVFRFTHRRSNEDILLFLQCSCVGVGVSRSEKV